MDNQLALFEEKEIRKTWKDKKWYFSVDNPIIKSIWKWLIFLQKKKKSEKFGKKVVPKLIKIMQFLQMKYINMGLDLMIDLSINDIEYIFSFF